MMGKATKGDKPNINTIAMHGAYRSQNFSTAISMCKQLRDQFDGRLTGYYDMWIERCEFQLTQKLPEDWNGVFIATSKQIVTSLVPQIYQNRSMHL